MTRKIIAAAGIALSLVALWWAVRDVDFAQVGAAFGRIQWVWFALAVPPWAFTFWAKVRRWQLLYYPDDKTVSRAHLLAALLIGYLFNTILPFRTGELARATVLRLRAGLPIARTLSTILVEKVLDTMTLVLGLLLILPFIQLPRTPVDFQSAALLAASVFSALFVAIVLAAIWPGPVRRAVAAVLGVIRLPARWAGRLLGLVDHVLAGLAPLRQRALLPGLVVWSLNAWVWNVVSIWCLLVSFGLLPPPSEPALVVIATNLGMSLPSAPGYVGVYHEIAKEALLVFPPYDENLAVAMAFVLHAFGFLPLALAGALALAREGLSMGELRAPVPADPAGPPPVTPTTRGIQ